MLCSFWKPNWNGKIKTFTTTGTSPTNVLTLLQITSHKSSCYWGVEERNSPSIPLFQPNLVLKGQNNYHKNCFKGAPLYPFRQALFTLGFCSHCHYVHEVCVTILSPPPASKTPPLLPFLPLLPPSPPSPPPLCTLPVFVTLSICNHNVSEFLHHCLSTFIHKLQCSLIVWFLKTVPIGKSEITIN